MLSFQERISSPDPFDGLSDPQNLYLGAIKLNLKWIILSTYLPTYKSNKC